METNTPSSSSGIPAIKYVPLLVPLLALLQLVGTLLILVGVLGGCAATERHPLPPPSRSDSGRAALFFSRGSSA
jgi:hypothetical protein